MTTRPSLHLTVGLPGAGKTTVARTLAEESHAVRFSPDEWMIPLFGQPEAAGKRDVLEGLLLHTAHDVLLIGGSVVLDFGCWSEAERWAVRAVAEHAGATFHLHFVDVAEDVRRTRATARWERDPSSAFEMTAEDHDWFLSRFERPSDAELAGGPVPQPPPGHQSWLAWARERWPGLPDLG